MEQHEITQKKQLLDSTGHLTEPGYAKHMLLQYNREQAYSKLKLKEWDYYFVTDGINGVALTVADNGYMGLMSASLLNFTDATEQTTSVMTVLPMGKYKLPASSEKGVTEFHNKQCDFMFTTEGKTRTLHCRFDNFKDGKTLTTDIILTDEPDETMVIATPFDGNDKAFYYNQKINCMKASGSAEFDGKKITFSSDSARGLLDWGRGIWTYENTWLWGSASGIVDGHEFGFNLGYGFGNTSAATENMLIYDGKAHKLNNVTFNIPLKGFDQSRGGQKLSVMHDFLKPWTYTSDDGRFEADFIPVLDRNACTDFKLLISDQHQVFGRFTGKAILDDGTTINFKDFFGFAEKVHNKW